MIECDSTVRLNLVDQLKNLRANLGSPLSSMRIFGTRIGSLIWGSSHRSFLTTWRIQSPSVEEGGPVVLVTKG